MFCQACGAHLPSEAKACPNCGTLTSAYDTNASAYDPTIPAVSGSSPYAMNAPAPSAQYGSNPYERSSQDPYYVNPYEAPPPPPRLRNHIGLIVGVVLLVLLLIGGSVFALLQYSSVRNAATTAAVTPTTVHTTTTASSTATLQHFTAKGTFTILSRTNVSVRQDGQNKIYSYTEQEVDDGDIVGSFTVEETSIVHADNTANFNGTSTCACTVDGKSGTLIYSYTGTSTANGNFQGQDFDGHGTGDLAKLHGRGTFQGQGLHGTYSSELYFDS